MNIWLGACAIVAVSWTLAIGWSAHILKMMREHYNEEISMIRSNMHNEAEYLAMDMLKQANIQFKQEITLENESDIRW